MYDFLKKNIVFLNFLKKNMIYLVLFSICVYILLHVYNNCNNTIVLFEIKIIYYILFFVIVVMVNSIMTEPQENLTKMITIFCLSLLVAALCNYFIEYYYINDSYYKFYIKLGICIAVAVGIFIIAALLYYLLLKKKDTSSDSLFSNFIKGYDQNISFLIFVTIVFLLFYAIFINYYNDTPLSDLITPSALAIILILYIFGFIIMLCNKIGLINTRQYLTTFIVLGSILMVLVIFFAFFLSNSLQNLCVTSDPNHVVVKDSTKEVMTIAAITTLVGILWLDDSRNWHQYGYIFFIIASVFTYYFVFTYSGQHPSMAIISLWLLVEWLILLFYRNANSKNSLEFIFMKT